MRRSFAETLSHLYVNPLEKCNLHCKMCYTRKHGNSLGNKQILDFIGRYSSKIKVKTVTFCGGEVFILKDFPGLVNKLTSQDIFVQIITNGTIDRLSEFIHPGSINMIVSLDGLRKYHDANRGRGNWQKSVNFLKKAIKMGFHTEVFSIATKENLPEIEEFEEAAALLMGKNIPITYQPRKPISYLQKHPISNIVGQKEGFSFMSYDERLKLGRKRKIFPPLNFGCYQISLMSDGYVYGCCEGTRPLGKIDDDIGVLLENLKNRLNKKLGCIEDNFRCGY